MAGESAAEVAQRLRHKAERQLEVAGRYEKGAAGERATADALAALQPQGWVVMHDLAWPGRARANIDHVVVGPAGVFVIDTKHWSGRVEVRGDELRQNGRQREASVSGAGEAGLAVTRIVSSHTGAAVTPVLCFHQEEPLAGWARDVMVCSTSNIVEMLRSRPPSLTPEQVRHAASALDATLRPAVAPLPSATGSSRTVQPRPGRSSRSLPPRRRSRGSAIVPAIVGGLTIAVVLVPSARNAVTDRVSEFIVSTSTEGAGPGKQPIKGAPEGRESRPEPGRRDER